MIVHLTLRKFPKETYLKFEGERKTVEELLELIKKYAKQRDMEVV